MKKLLLMMFAFLIMGGVNSYADDLKVDLSTYEFLAGSAKWEEPTATSGKLTWTASWSNAVGIKATGDLRKYTKVTFTATSSQSSQFRILVYANGDNSTAVVQNTYTELTSESNHDYELSLREDLGLSEAQLAEISRFAFSGSGEKGDVTVSNVVFVEAADPLAAYKATLDEAITRGKKYTDFHKTAASFSALTKAIEEGSEEYANASATGESLDEATTKINNAISALKYEDGYTPLTAAMFRHWTGALADKGEESDASCSYEQFNSAGTSYGDAGVSYLNYADLSFYGRLVINASEGAPRFLFNRKIDNGSSTTDESTTNLVEIPNQSWAAEKYQKVDGNVYTIDLEAMKETWGYAHLNVIKGANYQNVTITDYLLYDPYYAERAELEAALAKGNALNGFAKSAASVKAVSDAVAAGELILSDVKATGTQMSGATAAINAAFDALDYDAGYYPSASSLFHGWNGVTADAIASKQVTPEIHFFGTYDGGTTLYGDGSVNNSNYADLQFFDKIYVAGAKGAKVRLLLNRQEDNSLTEVAPVTDSETGVAEYDVTAGVMASAGYAHLNAIKLPYEGAKVVSDVIFYASAPTVTIGETGYTTFSRPFPLDLSNLPEGVTAYYASAVGSSSVTLTSTTAKVTAGTGLILKGTAGSYTIPVAKQSETSDLAGNLLVGVTAATSVDVDENKYVLVKNNTTDVAEFQSLKTNGATVPAGKAYLEVAGAAANLRIVFDGEATAINVLHAAKAESDVLYNVAGQRVNETYKGIVIKNGKKYLSK